MTADQLFPFREVFSWNMIEMVGLIPWVISMVVAGILWKWILNGDIGLVNYLCALFGTKTVYVFNEPKSSLATMIFVMSWRTVGYAMAHLFQHAIGDRRPAEIGHINLKRGFGLYGPNQTTNADEKLAFLRRLHRFGQRPAYG